MSFPNIPALVNAVTLFAFGYASAEDWPVYRGLDGDGIYKADDWRKNWDEKAPAPLWEANVGLGFSSMVISEGKLYTLGHNGTDADTLVCLDAVSGKEIWSHSYPHPLDDHYYGGGTTGVPTVHAGHVYSLARRGQLFCFEAATGKIKWSTNLIEDHDQEMPEWGFTGAPVVYNDLLLINANAAGLALNLSDGSVVWTSKKELAGYSSPYLFKRGDRDLAIFTNKRAYVCVDPKTGEEFWSEKWMTRYGVNAADPIITDDHVFISSGYEKGATLLAWTGPKQAEPETVWKSRDYRAQMNPPVLIDGYLYGIDGNEKVDGTGLKCLNLLSGEVKWNDTSFGHGAGIAAGNHLITVSEQGKLSLALASPEKYAPVASMDVIKGRVWTAPVLANGLLYIRNEKGDLVCLDIRK